VDYFGYLVVMMDVITWIWCFVDRASWYICTMWTNRMHYLLSIYFNN